MPPWVHIVDPIWDSDMVSIGLAMMGISNSISPKKLLMLTSDLLLIFEYCGVSSTSLYVSVSLIVLSPMCVLLWPSKEGTLAAHVLRSQLRASLSLFQQCAQRVDRTYNILLGGQRSILLDARLPLSCPGIPERFSWFFFFES